MSNYYSGLLMLVGINIIAVAGVSILTGFTRLFSFGNAGFMAIGAYTSAILSASHHVPFLPSVAAGAIVAGALGVLLGRLTLHLKGDYFLITTLGFGEVVRLVIEYADPLTGGARGFSGISPDTSLTTVFVSAAVALLVARNLLTSKYGRNLTAIREQEMAAEAVGIDTTNAKILSFATSAVFAGWAGGLFAHYMTFITPAMFNLDKSAELTITVVIGGLGSLTGSVLASMLLTVLPELLRAASELRMFLYGVSVVLIITLWPRGLMGYRELNWNAIKRLFRFHRNTAAANRGAV